jgi:hypothetical protein
MIREWLKKRKIPRGFYCYTIESIQLPTIRIKKCPYFYHDDIFDNVDMCSLLHCELDDSCKACGINE